MEASSPLHELAEVVGGHVIGDPQTVVSDVTHDSRQVGPGTLFIAIEGQIHDGHQFVGAAVEAGASALCVQHEVGFDVPQLVVGHTRRIAGELAAEVHGNPSRELDVIGITGTNGKTTVTHYVESLLAATGHRTGLVGTLGSRVVETDIASTRTTPEATDFQRLLARMRDGGAEKVAVEVSSHALELDRVRGTRFAVAGFTNLSQDHLDFHPSMEAYRSAKSRLFTEYDVGAAVFNIDDPLGRELSRSFPGPLFLVGGGGDFSAEDVQGTDSATEFLLTAPGFRDRISAPLLGDFNVSNLLVAMACCVALGLSTADLVAGLSGLRSVPGRYEVVSNPGEPTVIVDYAHTPDGILRAVAAARGIASGRVFAVVGAGGDRDRAKRGPMGRAASTADLVIVTSDNPRSEDPETIVDQVLEGVSAPSMREPDRERAIALAISGAAVEDLVLILGKGHETGQEVAGEVLGFDDRRVAREQLDSWSKSANSAPDSGSMRS